MALNVARELTIGSPPAKEGNELGNCEVAQERGGSLTPSPSANALGTPPLQVESLNQANITQERGGVFNSPPPPDTNGQGTPPWQGESQLNRVLYIDWELTEEDFVQRWGSTDVPENFFWAGFNADSEMPQHIPDRITWLLQNFTTTVKETEANIVIIDQPDRLHLTPQKWNEFLTQLKAMMRQFNLSVMLVVSNKSRHTGRPCGLNNIPKGNLLIPVADSVVMMCQNQRRTCERYFKVLKNRNRPTAENIEEVDIVELEEYEGFYQIHPWGRQAEKAVLPPSASERREQEKNAIGSPPAKEGNELSNYEVAQERGGGFGLVQPEHEATPSPSANALGTPPLQGESLNPSPSLREGTPFIRESFFV